jgi:DNA helicase II / ATP-dependent DNA helicase PcrA
MEILDGLNPQQQSAVTAPGGPILVLAGPGSGKTRVLTHRIAYLVQEQRIPPWQIMAVTFTNKAAREMRDRVERLLGGQLDGLTLGTFHATCARILRREADYLRTTPDFCIYDTQDQESVAKLAIRALGLDDKQYTPRKMLNRISRAKNELITPDLYRAESYLDEIAGRVYEHYQRLLGENNAYDFDDLLTEVVLLFDAQPEVLLKYQHRYRHVLVDEFQDTNTAQYALLTRLAGDQPNLFCVGDEDQSIYLFRGADWRNVRRFRDDFDCQTILLEQNYRSTQIILDAAQTVIRRNPHRTHKALFTDRRGGSQIIVREAFDEDEQAAYVADTIRRLATGGEATAGGCAVMYRTNAQSRRLEEAFVRAGMPYRLVGATRFYGRREVKDVVAFLRLVHNPADSVSLLRIINVPPRGIGAKTITALEQWAARDEISLGEALDRVAAGEPNPFAARAARVLASFAELVHQWVRERDQLAVADLMDLVIDQSGYEGTLRDGTPEGEERWENVLELRKVAADYPSLSLAEFLEQVALVSDVDNLTDEVDAPTLLTLHAAKGLEFDHVFIVGLEDDMLPHRRSYDDPDAMAEERRLFYVGITRARDQLYLLHAFRRSGWGDVDYGRPSRFLSDIPAELIAGGGSSAPVRETATDWSWSRAAEAGRTLPQAAWVQDAVPAARPAPAGPTLKTGQRVRHLRFGEGVVVETEPGGDGDEIVTVAFEGQGLKRLLASMAKLEALEG